ncbi:histidinol-phosphatase HisJ [Salipaludibacillus aurantiacus]|uniref:Histidinol-phosphatase n=1 Tax=Salipaludibacillus aurantiacus TaxID=1601833 RepID=A0A1H9WNJ7_9BACI|nr:histidinol-phosphatase HisJ [Salipaludibacillus aurantiacus]SES35496.1 histidinol-phosphatase (PHP family) [Salipaludibacillus aurantiacus]
MILHDGHVHSHFCPHGSADKMEEYIERAIKLGLSSISFTEHAPLPRGFKDPVPGQDSAITLDVLPEYLKAAEELKNYYSSKINVNTGLEVDYIDGYEIETASFLNEWGGKLDDTILSVHFLRLPDNSYICLDYSPEAFQSLIEKCGSLKKSYELYYKTLLQSVKADLGPFTPVRIGHITLIRKFQKLFPRNFDDSLFLEEVMTALNEYRKEMDVNTAGLEKVYCKETYPPQRWIEKAVSLDIPLVYGSDAHSAGRTGGGRSSVEKYF